MNKKREVYYRGLYLIAAIFSFVSGIGFLFFYKFIFNLTAMQIPENPSYLTFSAAMMVLFGILIFMIYKDLNNSRKIVIYAIFVKFAFAGTVLYYYLTLGSYYVGTPFLIFGAVDFIWALLFIESLRFIKK